MDRVRGLSSRRRVRFVVMLAAIVSLGSVCALSGPPVPLPATTEPAAGPVDADNPIVQLRSAPVVQKEIGASDRHVQLIDAAYAKVEPRLFLLRRRGYRAGGGRKSQAARQR